MPSICETGAKPIHATRSSPMPTPGADLNQGIPAGVNESISSSDNLAAVTSSRKTNPPEKNLRPDFILDGTSDMPDISFSCPTCGQTIVIDQRAAGRRVPCPHCTKTCLVPPLGDIQKNLDGPLTAPTLAPDYPSIIRAVAEQRGVAAKAAAAIPKKHAMHAREIHCIPNEEEILVLFDMTLLGSAKKALVLTSHALYGHYNKRMLSVRIPYSDFPSRQFEFRCGLGLGETPSIDPGDYLLQAHERQQLDAIVAKLKACTIAAQTSAPKEQDRQFQFHCALPSAGFSGGLSEALGVFCVGGTSGTCSLICVPERNRLSLYQKLTRTAHQTLTRTALHEEYAEVLSRPIRGTPKVRYREVAVQEQLHTDLWRSIGIGVGGGVGLCFISHCMEIATVTRPSSHPIQTWFETVLLLGVLGGVVGIIKNRFSKHSANSISHGELLILTRSHEVALALTVPLDEIATAFDALHEVGWTPEGTSERPPGILDDGTGRNDPGAEVPRVSRGTPDLPLPEIAFACTCGKRYRVKRKENAAKYRCPGCGKLLVVPGQQVATQSEQSPD